MSLAHEIVAALPALMKAHPQGPRVKELAAFLAAPEAGVRAAMAAIKESGAAIIVRYPGSKARHVVPLGHRFNKITTANRHRPVVCRCCDTLFQNGSRKFCSKSCFATHMWAQPGHRQRLSAALKKAHSTPEAKARAVAWNQRRSSDPNERARISENNRKAWADPAHKAKRSASLQAALGTPEKRRFFSELRKQQWQDPAFRAKACAAMREARTSPAYKKKMGDQMRARWANPVTRVKLMAAAKERAAAKPLKGRKQSPEHVAKRVASRKASSKARRAR